MFDLKGDSSEEEELAEPGLETRIEIGKAGIFALPTMSLAKSTTNTKQVKFA